MSRYTATRLILRVCVLVTSIGPARGQAPVSELVILPAPPWQDELADPPPPVRASIDQSASAPAPKAEPESESEPEPEPEPRQRGHGSVTRITLSAGELPTAPRRPLPPQPAPATHPMERDVLTLKAARAAIQLDDALHERRLAATR